MLAEIFPSVNCFPHFCFTFLLYHKFFMYNSIMLKIVEISEKTDWDNFINTAGGHPLQLWGWGELKKAHGWKVKRIFVEKEGIIISAAQILVKKLPKPLNNFAYIPRGPVILTDYNEEKSAILEKIAHFAKTKIKPTPVCLSVEPDWGDFTDKKGKWKKAKNTILIPKTLIIDLAKTDEELQAEMAKKTRQYIRKSSDSISVREIKTAAELETCLDIYEETASRANFAIHDRQYYRDLKELMNENSPIFGAFSHDNELLAFLWPVISDKTSFELYGGVNDKGQKLRANFTLKWQTMQILRERGVVRYDLNGLLNDGISNFKRGFAKHEDELCGTYDYPFSVKYVIWSEFLPTAKKIIRKLKK